MSKRRDGRRMAGRVRLGLVLRLSLIGLLASLSAVHLVAAIRANLIVVGPSLANRVGNRVGSDFPIFCAAARLAWHGGASGVYDVETLRGAYGELVGAEVPGYPWTYPPTFFLLAPLAILPPVTATWLWIGLTVAWLTAAVWRCVPWWVMPILVILFPAIAHAIVTGPTGTLTAALLASVAATLTSAPILAGLFVALLRLQAAPCGAASALPARRPPRARGGRGRHRARHPRRREPRRLRADAVVALPRERPRALGPARRRATSMGTHADGVRGRASRHRQRAPCGCGAGGPVTAIIGGQMLEGSRMPAQHRPERPAERSVVQGVVHRLDDPARS
jgi:hypothetical protein